MSEWMRRKISGRTQDYYYYYKVIAFLVKSKYPHLKCVLVLLLPSKAYSIEGGKMMNMKTHGISIRWSQLG